MLIIGLTGGIGSGKSAASEHFERMGITVVDADVVARQVVEPSRPALAQIAAHFGDDILLASGSLDRQKLRQLIFKSAQQKTWLESLLHPIIRDEIIHQLKCSHSPYTLLVSPLLFETKQHELVNRTLLIDAPKALQIERASQRDDVTSSQIETIIASQMTRECKIEKADDIILNDSDLGALQQEVERYHTHYLELSYELNRS